MGFNTTFNNISVISWRSVLLVEETGVPEENHWPAVSHRQTLSHIIHFNNTTSISFSIQSCRSCYATQHLCRRSFCKIFVKFKNSKKNVLKIVLIIVNINKDENKSLISNQFTLKNDFPPTSWRTILWR